MTLTKFGHTLSVCQPMADMVMGLFRGRASTTGSAAASAAREAAKAAAKKANQQKVRRQPINKLTHADFPRSKLEDIFYVGRSGPKYPELVLTYPLS